MSTIGERIKSERNHLDVAQKIFAQWGNVSLKSQVLYEKGERFPDARYLASIEKKGADIHYIITGIRKCELTGEEKPRLYNRPEDALFVVLEVQESLGIKFEAEQLKSVLGYTYTAQLNQKDLKEFLESALRLHGIEFSPK